MKSRTLSRLSLFAAAGVASLLSFTSMADSKKDAVDLTCRMSVPAKPAAKNIPFTFEISNRGKQAVNVLSWNTPLEGFYGKFLEINGPAGEAEYNGAMVKRGAPTREDYVIIRPGATVTKTLNLATAYDIKAAGKYEITFVGKLTDATTAKIPRGFTEHAAFDLNCAPVKFEIVRGGGK